MSDRPRGPLSQIAVGVVVAALVGGSSPWWWNELKARFTSQSSPTTVQHAPAPNPSVPNPPGPAAAPADNYSQSDYEAVQSIYERRQNAKTCVDVKRLTSRMQQYFGNQHLVPPKFVDTIRYPAPVPKPTISDLAKDRIARIKDARPKCFP
jgi:cytoskeletal protein RodZ